MRATTVAELIELMQPAEVELVGDDGPVGPDVVIDSRAATDGALFVAITGEHVDGHDFARPAVERGAGAVLGTHLTDADVPHILAEDPVRALSWVARGVVRRERARGMVSVGITGSSGKTSTKDLLAQVLEAAGPTVAPLGSQNNEIGVPLTACRVDSETRFLVSEMGARGVGHIAWLTSLVGLDIGVCLNVGQAHVGEFGSLEVTAAAKSEIVADLPAEGWAVLNADDPRVTAMAALASARVAWFGEGDLPDGDLTVTARGVTLNPLTQASFELVARFAGQAERSVGVQLGVIGRHQVANALAAAAAALAAGLDLATVGAALSSATTRSQWRMELRPRPDGVLVLNDAYNANPDSMAVALSTAVELVAGSRAEHPTARAVAVLGDMLELGPTAADLHEELGRRAADAGISEVVAVGEFAGRIVSGALEGGVPARESLRDDVAASLSLSPGDVVLIKASRGVGLEKVAANLVVRDGAAS
ncbi:UDP-N-acetylmuramoyl-tripeptide--D-alanyl-D-alanine ligase [Tessaracoccus palaemonis]|uniref:UDP-N-acetylmuramoyl-tripeptide--D-alanyl-D-alanine ligase n=1 Tax=Tessaracoccus palaemonis TaxID=2829499 RepID=A0ABX8SH57_9ACTN|nr:UDP-N-acetylmuramoyl-tripeptide--D-alanyl-D-alanine ligase [Tessaracoccus palaemonis]QXT62020.1 UDP-N-acetylmuramoyl-tripeptide--D-alanyl-D-alanine ligase [Tessaracoccus palaemonis]